MIICDHDIVERQMIEKIVLNYYRDKKITTLIRCCADWQELSRQIIEKPADTIIIAQNGVAGLDMIIGLKVATGRLIWFSDLDFGVQAYRMGINYFSMKPITDEKVVHALMVVEVS